MDHGMTKMISAIPAAESTVYREVNGLVQNGVVKFLGDPLPEGMLVKIRPSKT
jgi:predicted transcriptional regulator